MNDKDIYILNIGSDNDYSNVMEDFDKKIEDVKSIDCKQFQEAQICSFKKKDESVITLENIMYLNTNSLNYNTLIYKRPNSPSKLSYTFREPIKCSVSGIKEVGYMINCK